MQAKTFIGRLAVRIGESENMVSYLVVASSRDAAFEVLDNAAQSYYGDEDTPQENGGYFTHDGEVFTSASALEEIGQTTFLELKSILPVRCQASASSPRELHPDQSFSDLAQALTQALNRKAKVVSHSQVLHALASAYGHKNWQVLKSKLDAAFEPTLAPTVATGTPRSNELERLRVEMQQERTPAYGDALALCRRLEAELAQALARLEPFEGMTPFRFDPKQPTQAIGMAAMGAEVARIGEERLRRIKAEGYQLKAGDGGRWYALLPGESELRTSNSGAALNAIGYFSTLDDLVAELEVQINKGFGTLLGLRQAAAQRVIDNYDFPGTVAGMSGWTSLGNQLTRAIFLEDSESDSPSWKFELTFVFAEGSSMRFTIET